GAGRASSCLPEAATRRTASINAKHIPQHHHSTAINTSSPLEPGHAQYTKFSSVTTSRSGSANSPLKQSLSTAQHHHHVPPHRPLLQQPLPRQLSTRRPLRPRRPRHPPLQPLPQHSRPKNHSLRQQPHPPILSPSRKPPHKLARPTRYSQTRTPPPSIRYRRTSQTPNGIGDRESWRMEA
ncbi:hypothetical protein CB0940_06819, partial [Cercospora beticola]